MILNIRETNNSITFKVFILPKSSKNMVSGLHDDALKIKLTAPPVDGAANKMCIKFLSKILSVSKSSLEIVSGHTGRTKQIRLNLQDQTAESKEKALNSITSLIKQR